MHCNIILYINNSTKPSIPFCLYCNSKLNLEGALNALKIDTITNPSITAMSVYHGHCQQTICPDKSNMCWDTHRWIENISVQTVYISEYIGFIVALLGAYCSPKLYAPEL